ncbi:MAG: TetR/AcrR family transcriptional regulator, partial [Rhodospirillaceae bacterium]|nr:TetR/AcrR family transcriptional regulator [Rhodospirillaceae bacterium]
RTPDPRIVRSRRIILAAVLEELGEVGYGAFSIERVAARAGVGKSTIYRHWRDKVALIAAAFETLHGDTAPDLATGSARDRLERIMVHVAEIARHSTYSACIPALIEAAERDPSLRRFHHRFQRAARTPTIAVIRDGVASGEFPRHVQPELAAMALLGAIFFRRLMTPAPLEAERVADLIETVLGR